MMVKVSREEFSRIARAQRANAAARKAKRQAKAAVLWPAKLPKAKKMLRRTKISQVSTRGALKAAIVRLLGLLDRKLNGAECRLGHLCPAYRDMGKHPGQCAYHLLSQKRGGAAWCAREGVVWACFRANYGEQQNRDLYRTHHVTLFGAARMERLEALARIIRKFSMAELLDLRAEIKADLEKI